MVLVKAEYLPDEKDALTLAGLQAGEAAERWQPLLEDYANFGYQPHPFWYRFAISNPSDQAVSQVLAISYPLLDSIDLYRIDAQGNIHHTRTGDREPFAQRPVAHPHFLFPMRLLLPFLVEIIKSRKSSSLKADYNKSSMTQLRTAHLW